MLFEYDGWWVNKCLLRIGDVGMLFDILYVDGLFDCFVVEFCEINGIVVWFVDFERDELEL